MPFGIEDKLFYLHCLIVLIMKKVAHMKFYSFMTLCPILILYCVANFITAMPTMNSRKWRNFKTEKVRDVTNFTLQNNGLEDNNNIISVYTTNYQPLSTSNYVMSRFEAIYNTSNLKSSTLSSTWNISSSSTRSTTISGENKENNDKIAVIAVGIIFGGAIALYLLYLSLLLSVAFWRYVFLTYNCHTYVEIIE